MSEPIVGKFSLYLLLAGICHPTFDSFGYYFTIMVMHISQVSIGIGAAL